MRLPSDPEIRALHERHSPAPAALNLVYTHCQIVAGVAAQLLDRGDLGLDAGLVRAGSMLHDIGVYRLFGADGQLNHASYLRHGILGYDLLRDEGLPEALCRFCSRHTGMGLSPDDVRRQRLPLPPGDYRAETGEDQLVMYADKFHSKTDPPVFLTADAYASTVRRFGTDKAAAFAAMRARFGEPDLTPFAAAYGYGFAPVPWRMDKLR
jgi:uncharacterized protein